MEALQNVLIGLAVALVVAFLTGALNSVRNYLNGKLTTAQLELLNQIAEIAVWAIEQTGPGTFATKRDAAIAIIKEYLEAHGFEFPDTVIEAVVESSVATSFNYNTLVKGAE